MLKNIKIIFSKNNFKRMFSKNTFDFADPFLFQKQLSPDELMIQDIHGLIVGRGITDLNAF